MFWIITSRGVTVMCIIFNVSPQWAWLIPKKKSIPVPKPKHRTMNMCGAWRCSSTRSLKHTTNWRCVISFTLAAYCRGRFCVVSGIEGCLGPRTNMKNKMSRVENGNLVVQSVVSNISDWVRSNDYGNRIIILPVGTDFHLRIISFCYWMTLKKWIALPRDLLWRALGAGVTLALLQG